MKVLFIGGTGIISTACVQLAAQRGVKVSLLNRGQHSAEAIPSEVETIIADINQPDAVIKALAGRTFDVVANFIAFTPEQIERDLQLFKGKIGQYIFISSASIYQKPPSHYLITESTPLANPHWEYSRNKIACEDRLTREYRDHHFPITIIRPSLTYDEKLIPLAVGSWSRPWTIVDRMRQGKPIIVHGDGSSLWTTTHNTDFAKGFVGLLGHAQAIGHAFHITSDEVLSWDQHYQIVGQAAGVQPKLVHIPSEALVSYDRNLEGNLLGDKSWSTVFDNTKIKTFVPDYVATTTFAQGMQRAVGHFLADPKRQLIDEKFNQWCDKVLADFQRALPASPAS